jgi:hypothetical protein
MANKEIKDKLVAGGVKNLKEFGYPSVNASTIITDYVYSRFFISMLNENREEAIFLAGFRGKEIAAAIDELLVEIAQAEVKKEPKAKTKSKKKGK